MEPVLLGMAAPAAVDTAGSLVERTLQSVAEPFAAVLQSMAAVLSTEHSAPAVTTLDHLHDEWEALRAELVTDIESALTLAGIDLSEPIALRISDADGQLEVIGDHPQKTLIESALADNPDLASKFTAVAALQQVFAVADELAAPDMAEVIALGEAENTPVTALFSAEDDGATLEFRL